MNVLKKNLLLLLLISFNIIVAQTYISENFDSGLGSFSAIDEGSATGDSWSSGDLDSFRIGETDAAYVSNNFSHGGGGEGGEEGPFMGVAAKSQAIAFKETLLTPVFDSSAATKLILKFDESYNGSDNDDIALVQVYNGTSWVTVHTHAGNSLLFSSETVEIDIASYKNAVMQVRFVFDDLGVEGNYWMVDDVSVVNTSCSDPSNILVSDIEDTSATINFTVGYSETAWEIIVQESSLDEPNVAGESIVQNSYTATNLTENTSYEVYVRASCGAGDFSNWVKSSNFTTPYTCPKPDNIKSSNSTPSSISVSWAVMGDETEWEIEYGPKDFTNDNGEGVIISNVITNPYVVTNLDSDTSYQFYVRAVCGEDNKSIWEGITERSTLKACEEPTDFKAISWSSTSVDIEWSQGYQESSWELEYGINGFSQGTGTMVVVTQNSHEITGLSEDTSYDVYIRSLCTEEEQSEWVQLNSFSTLCATVQEVVLEDFETYNSKFVIDDEDCLLQEAVTSAKWFVNTGATGSNGTGPEAGSGGSGYYAYLEANSNVDTDYGSTADLYLNYAVDLSVFTTPTISFDYHMVGNEMGDLQLYIVDENGVSSLIKQFEGEQQSDTSDDFLTATVDLNTYANQEVRFFFRAVRGGTFAGDMAIDNIKVFDLNALSVSELQKKSSAISVYPNPANSKVTVLNINQDSFYEVFDMSGTLVSQGELSKSNNSLSLEGLSGGVYLLKINEKVIRVIKE